MLHMADKVFGVFIIKLFVDKSAVFYVVDVSKFRIVNKQIFVGNIEITVSQIRSSNRPKKFTGCIIHIDMRSIVIAHINLL